jgi:hypothetical protein
VPAASAVPGGVGCVVGAWLIAAPFVVGYRYGGAGASATLVDVLIGLTLVAVGAAALRWPHRTRVLVAVIALLGCLLLLAPFVFDYNDGVVAPRATVNDLIVGLALVAYALIHVALDTVPTRRSPG